MEHTRHLRGMDKQPDSVQPDNNQVCDVGAAVMRQLIGHVTLESIGTVRVSAVESNTLGGVHAVASSGVVAAFG